MNALVEIEELTVDYSTMRGQMRALDGTCLTVHRGEIIGIVGESGSGKSTLGVSLGRLPVPGYRHISGDIRIDGTSVFQLDQAALRTLRADRLGYVFQDPIAALDPTTKIGRQVALAVKTTGVRPEQALIGLGFTDIPRVLASYPHEVSGGMAQRIGIALALANRPEIVVADEPTAALDPTVKTQVLDLLVDRCRIAGAALMLLSHDLNAIRRYTDRIAVVYGGRVVEAGPTGIVLGTPQHPYTQALLKSAIGREAFGQRVEPISGIPPRLTGRLKACSFAPRCTVVLPDCSVVRPEPRTVGGITAICHRVSDANVLEPIP